MFVFPSQSTPVAERCEWITTQFTTLKVGSNIHRQARVLSTLGMIHGSSSAARTNRWAGKTWFSRRAITIPSASLKTVVMAV